MTSYSKAAVLFFIFILHASNAQYSINFDRDFRLSSYVPRSNYQSKIFRGSRTHTSGFESFSRNSGHNVREKDIAAVFRGVAYGANESPEVSKTTTTTTEPTTQSTTPATTTSTLSDRHFIDTESLETLNVIPATSSAVPGLSSNAEGSGNGILNYYVEDSREHRHNGRQEYYPEVIASVSPNDASSKQTDSDSYVVSKNGNTQSILVHVYMIGILMGSVILASLCCLCRINSCTQLIPRGHYVTLQLLIVLAASLRCITLFHDPYGLDGKLPRALMALLMNSVPPLLSTAFALMLLVLLRAAKYFILPAPVQSPLVLAVICGLHIGCTVLVDVSNGVLHYPKSSIKAEVGMQTVTIIWDCILIIGYLIILYQVFINATKRRIFLPVAPCAVMGFSVLLKAIMITFMFYHITVKGQNIPHVAEKSWSWWIIISCERLLEIAFCATLLIAAATLTMKQTILNTKEQKVFSVISGYDQNTIRIGSPSGTNYTASNYALASTLQKKNQSINPNFSSKTLMPGSTKVCDSTADFAIQWNVKRPKPDVCPSRIVDENVDGTLVKPPASYFSQTLPTQPRYYYAPVPHIGTNSPVLGRLEPCNVSAQKTPNIYSEIEDPAYDVSPYYTKPVVSTSSEIYSSPQISGPRYGVANSTDHLYELPGLHNVSSYNTTTPTRVNGSKNTQEKVCVSEDFSYGSNSNTLILPLYTSPSIQQAQRTHYHQQRPNNPQLDTSPDSAIVLDYSSHSELEEQQQHKAQGHKRKNSYHERKISPTSKLDFMNLSTHSLNEVFKHNSGLLSKLVGTSNTNTGYQPLNLEEVSCSNNYNSDFNYSNDDGPAHGSPLISFMPKHFQNEGTQNSSSSSPPPVTCPLIPPASSSPVTSL